MYDIELEYSYSGGKYWSKYPHCRVFENGTYDVVVRDNYGQTTTTQVEVENNKKTILTPPSVLLSNSDGSYQEYTWSSTAVTAQMTASTSYYIDYMLEGDANWTLGERKSGFLINIAKNGMNNLLVRTRDDYGNTSIILTYPVWIDTSAPTNLNFVPEVTYANEIETTVSAIESTSLPMRYSITYDNGKTWSEPQLGRNFGLINPAKGTYQVNCRAYNAAGLYVEGIAVERVITDTIQ